ncbi:MAG TPA: hypothetical protein VNN09_02670 [Candidatus Competibacteraceae bacterium]|nr:hypothetical protein [Candidatus Competibacteraceae bacterium]
MELVYGLFLLGFLLFLVLLAVLLRYGQRLDIRQQAERERRCRQLGWRLEPGHGLSYTIHGESDGIPWRVDYDTSGEDPSLDWRSEALRAAALSLHILGHTRYRVLHGKLGQAVFAADHGLASLAGIDDEEQREFHDFIASEPEQPVGSETFRRRFAVLAHDPGLVQGLLEPSVEQLFLAWPELGEHPHSEHFLSVSLDRSGLRVSAGNRLSEMSQIEQLVRLGVTLATRLRQRLPPPQT